MATLCGCDITVPLLLHTCRTVHFLLRRQYLTHTCDFDDCQNLQENTFMMNISIFVSATSSSASSVSLSRTSSLLSPPSSAQRAGSIFYPVGQKTWTGLGHSCPSPSVLPTLFSTLSNHLLHLFSLQPHSSIRLPLLHSHVLPSFRSFSSNSSCNSRTQTCSMLAGPTAFT